MNDPNLWFLAGILMVAPHLSKSAGLFFAACYFGFAIYMRHFA
jgi:hypothetical protein